MEQENPTLNQPPIQNDELSKEKETKELSEKMFAETEKSLIEQYLFDNQIEFPFNDKVYRVRRPSFAEKQLASRSRIEKFNELLKDDSLMFEKVLVEKLKAKGVDITAIENKISASQSQKESIQYKLGKALEDKVADNITEELKQQLKDINNEQLMLLNEKNSYLEFSLEKQLLSYIYTFLCTLVTEEKQPDNTWKKVWNNYNEFINSKDEVLVRTATFYTALIAKEDVEL
jgi:hypothetical protein